jgi:hypothetical protein
MVGVPSRIVRYPTVNLMIESITDHAPAVSCEFECKRYRTICDAGKFQRLISGCKRISGLRLSGGAAPSLPGTQPALSLLGKVHQCSGARTYFLHEPLICNPDCIWPLNLPSKTFKTVIEILSTSQFLREWTEPDGLLVSSGADPNPLVRGTDQDPDPLSSSKK